MIDKDILCRVTISISVNGMNINRCLEYIENILCDLHTHVVYVHHLTILEIFEWVMILSQKLG